MLDRFKSMTCPAQADDKRKQPLNTLLFNPCLLGSAIPREASFLGTNFLPGTHLIAGQPAD